MVLASGSTTNISGEVLQAHQCSSLSIMPKILFIILSCILNVANVALEVPPERAGNCSEVAGGSTLHMDTQIFLMTSSAF